MKHKAKKCGECKGKTFVDWHYLDGEVKMETCPRCGGTGKEPKPQPKPNESTATDVFGRTFTLKEKLQEARASKLSQCCGAKVWISRLGKKVCTKCHKAEQPKPKSKCPYGETWDNPPIGKPKPKSECEHIWGVDTSETVRKGQVFCLNCGKPKPEEDAVFNGKVAKQVTRYRKALEDIVRHSETVFGMSMLKMSMAYRIAKKALEQ